MNYQFIRDQNGSPIAKFEMGSEVFSQWFSDELGRDKQKLDAIFEAIKQLDSKQIKEFELAGNELNLIMDADEVEVRSKFIDADAPDELPEGTEVYDQESIAGCGLEDFAQVLKSWQAFI